MNALIERCRLAGIRLWGEDGTLRYDAPKGAMTPELITDLKTNRPELLAALARPGSLPPLPHAAEARRRKVLALVRDGKQYAIYIEAPDTDPVIAALATPAGTCEVLIPRDRYGPFDLLAKMQAWQA
jgi:TubC N-terminal docking domain